MTAIITSIFLGVGLAAAAGFRVFVPLLAMSLAAHFNIIPLNESWQWVGSFPAIIALGVACVFEIGAYFIPWFDNALDTIALPLAGIAGTAAVAATVADLSPLMTWSLAIIAGGGTAGAIKTANAGTRLSSTVATGGIGNPIISFIETVVSFLLGILALLLPFIAFGVVIVILIILYRMYRKFKNTFASKDIEHNTSSS